MADRSLPTETPEGKSPYVFEDYPHVAQIPRDLIDALPDDEREFMLLYWGAGREAAEVILSRLRQEVAAMEVEVAQ
jgi:hypothetical protein